MWADSKIVGILKFGSTAQKLFSVEKWRPTKLLQKNTAKRGILQLSMTFEPLNLISKTNFFGICPHAASKILFLTV